MRTVPSRLLTCVFLLLLAQPVYAQNVSDYLILESVGSYSNSGKGRCGKGSGLIAATGHFGEDHDDTTCRTGYYNLQQDLAVSIQVTQHTGSDSDKWLSHELDMDFRSYYGLPGISYGPKQIDGHTILEDAAGGANYRWISGTKVIMIAYSDPQMTKPEPIEVVKAYLEKHPSTLPPMKLAELRNPEMKTSWIKNEMERRLWLCDKWFLQLQVGKAKHDDTLRTIVEHMYVFLDYREKYYGIKAIEEKGVLEKSLYAKDGTAIKNKLTAYKTWWSVNKTKSISPP